LAAAWAPRPFRCSEDDAVSLRRSPQSISEAALTAAERTEERRAVAIALDEEVPEGPSLAKARQVLAEAHGQHQRARDAIATLQAGLAAAALPVSSAEARVPVALAAVLESEGAIRRLLDAYDRSRSRAA